MKSWKHWGRCGLLALALTVGAPVALQAQQPAKPDEKTKVSQGEADLAKKLEKASKMSDRFKLAEQLIQKYPTSPIRPKIANFLLVEIANTKDADAKMSGIETYLSTFTDASEQDAALPVLLDAYITSKKWDEAFEMAPRVFEKNPNSVSARTQLVAQGVNMMQSGNRQYIEPSQKYAAQSIVVFESGQKPAEFTDENNWAEYKKSWLPLMYQAQGFLYMETAKRAEARASFAKAIQLNPADPMNYYAQGSMSNDEYTLLATQYKATQGPEQAAVLAKANAKLDEVIDFYAQAIAKASGKPEYKALSDNLTANAQSFYKYRKGSLDGFQALIDKYKK